jgi:tetraacyldisaccharide 4'-kinase
MTPPSAQVIAIGNLTVGGTGKTPVVEKFARELGTTAGTSPSSARVPVQPPRPPLIDRLLLREQTSRASF